ncbi:oxidoreductase [Bacillus canaveralius]|uniref:Oxidoreductase n=1 Tax=Bacillus canaveralius TaxID=1403243 RepID=A0A2N5GGU8_9BACI|nr:MULTISPECIES: PDR/VanB family oxidoreductase [Bacillus]PLR79930.1 oxidoreductase [Bacillus canaveralius]PLR83508.1 oxidoreductase [Bacillus sp. V33-4]PLR88439.1 oxidoreductase [Bacillus canaveralius]RSK58171.1 oxidoreductase [Bacillus canaveralius]
MSSGTIKVIVAEIKYESPTVKSFKLIAANGSSLPGFSGGSHLTTYIQSEFGLIERHYSLTNDPDTKEYYKIAIRRSDQSKGGSIFWHDHIKVGDQLEISYPRNHFSLSFKAKHHVFIAAGIGITPFLAMSAELKKKGKSFELHYAAPTKELCAFYSYLSSTYPEEANFYFSKEGRRMTTDVMKHKPIGTHVYFCGTEAMVREYQEAAKSYGYPEKSIHFELFTPPSSGPKHAFQVKLRQSDQMIDVPEGESLLETLLKHGIPAPHSCKIGGCGSCQVDVLDGEVDHRDLFLSDNERKEINVILTCVSRAKSGCLVLDL